VQLLSRILLLMVLLTAILFGAFNGAMVELDFVLAKWNLPLGVALLGFLVIGALLGAAGCYWALVPKLKARLKAAVASSRQTPTKTP
jgi:uncharacterized integral membrane protein